MHSIKDHNNTINQLIPSLRVHPRAIVHVTEMFVNDNPAVYLARHKLQNDDRGLDTTPGTRNALHITMVAPSGRTKWQCLISPDRSRLEAWDQGESYGHFPNGRALDPSYQPPWASNPANN